MSKQRVYEIAKTFKVSSEALVKILREMGFSVRSHMSILSEEMVGALKKRFQEEKEAVRKKEAKKKKISEQIKKHAEEDKKKREKLTKTTTDKEKKEATKKKRNPKKRHRFSSSGESNYSDNSSSSSTYKDKKKTKRTTTTKKKRKRYDKEKEVISEKEIKATVQKTLANIETTKKRKRYKKKDADEVIIEEEIKILKVSEFTSVSELAKMMEVSSSDVISMCFDLGMMVTINQRLEMDIITMIASEFGYEVEMLEEYAADILEEEMETEIKGEAVTRPPVVTIMGHVDHGKTSILDYIRRANVVAGESGGITQHIGAYSIEINHNNEIERITFIDTPGHEAFTSMRARGASVTDIVVLVIAADSSIMPQTVEAIDHARLAEVPIIIAINKCDLHTANPERVKQELTKYNLTSEDWGGSTIIVEVSAKTGENVDKLLEMILLQSEMMELTAIKDRPALGTIIESKIEKGRGVVATILVQEGTLKIGDPFVTGIHYGKVRAMYNERGKSVKIAGPSIPIEVLGCADAPQSGDSFVIVKSERRAKEIASRRHQAYRERAYRHTKVVTLDGIFEQIKDGQIEALNVIIKGDVDGSVEVITDALSKLSTDEVKVDVIHRAVGGINISDIMLALASEAIIIGFHVRPDTHARDLAAREHVDIRTYNIIYEVIEDVKKALEGMLKPEEKEVIIGNVEIRETFNIPRLGTIAGCYVTNGIIYRNSLVRLLRDSVIMYEGKINSLKRFKDDAKEVKIGYECGLSIEKYNDIKIGDVLEVYKIEHIARKLEL